MREGEERTRERERERRGEERTRVEGDFRPLLWPCACQGN